MLQPTMVYKYPNRVYLANIYTKKVLKTFNVFIDVTRSLTC